MSVYYFYGPDTYGAREAIGEIAERERARVRWLDKEDLAEDSWRQWIGQGGSSLFGREMVVARDPSALAVGDQAELLAVAKAPAGVVVLWDRGQPSRTGAVFQQLGQQARVFAALDDSRLAAWVAEEARRLGVELDGAAARMMVERVGSDRWRLKTELDKMALTLSKITVLDVKDMIPEAAQAEIFACLDALARGEKGRALQGIKALLAEGNSEFYILSMLAYQLRTLLVVRCGIDQGLKQFEVVRDAKLKQYAVQKNWAAARRRPAVVWRDGLTRVLATDVAIKQGRIDARTGVLMLVGSLVV